MEISKEDVRLLKSIFDDLAYLMLEEGEKRGKLTDAGTMTLLALRFDKSNTLEERMKRYAKFDALVDRLLGEMEGE